MIIQRPRDIGPLRVHTNEGVRGDRLPGHEHMFEHPTFCRAGWLLVRQYRDQGPDEVVQIASPGYRPDTVPYREPDGFEEGRRVFRVNWEGRGEPIEFAPIDYVLLIPEMTTHEILILSAFGALDCTFPHRFDDGTIAPRFTGWTEGYL